MDENTELPTIEPTQANQTYSRDFLMAHDFLRAPQNDGVLVPQGREGGYSGDLLGCFLIGGYFPDSGKYSGFFTHYNPWMLEPHKQKIRHLSRNFPDATGHIVLFKNIAEFMDHTQPIMLLPSTNFDSLFELQHGKRQTMTYPQVFQSLKEYTHKCLPSATIHILEYGKPTDSSPKIITKPISYAGIDFGRKQAFSDLGTLPLTD